MGVPSWFDWRGAYPVTPLDRAPLNSTDSNQTGASMLDLHRLTLLREVKLHGSMSAAARELSYSHSAISQQLSLLEKETGVVLLERVGRNVRLTPAGEELVR